MIFLTKLFKTKTTTITKKKTQKTKLDSPSNSCH
jgi:hypothetical protein